MSARVRVNAAHLTAGELLARKHLYSALPELIAVAPGETVRQAANPLLVYNLSQLPVLERGRMVGSIHQRTLLRLGDRLPGTLAGQVRAIMEKPLETATEKADYSSILDQLTRDSSAVVVTRDGNAVGILTAADAIEPWLNNLADGYSI